MTGGDLLYLHRTKNSIVYHSSFNELQSISFEEIESDQLRIAVREEARWLLF